MKFPVPMVDSPYTRVELMAEARRVITASRGVLDTAGPTGTLTGLRVGVNTTKAPAGRRDQERISHRRECSPQLINLWCGSGL